MAGGVPPGNGRRVKTGQVPAMRVCAVTARQLWLTAGDDIPGAAAGEAAA